MCRLLEIPRSLVYYKKKSMGMNTKLENEVIKVFKESHNNYGSSLGYVAPLDYRG